MLAKLLRPTAIATILITSTGACSSQSEEAPRVTATVALDPAAKLMVGANVDEKISKEVPVSGRDRILVPNTRDWSCGRPLDGMSMSNVAWIELLNPSDDTVSLAIALDGLPRTHPTLFVYGRREAPLEECRTLSLDRKLSDSSSVIVEPSSAAYVLLSAGGATGVYTLSVQTEHIIAP